MGIDVFNGVMLPFYGTVLGAACVFMLKHGRIYSLQKKLSGFAGGVMLAASIWSLIIPAIDYAADWKILSFVPALVGFWAGIVFLWGLDKLIFRLNESRNYFVSTSARRTAMLAFAVVLHNIPEGMAVGVAFACAMNTIENSAIAGAMALSVGIAIQNLPEGAIISAPLAAKGMSKTKSFVWGVLSGAVEPIAAFLTVILLEIALPLMPYVLSFAAGAMIYVVVDELIPEALNETNTKCGLFFFAIGFSIMMILDVAFG